MDDELLEDFLVEAGEILEQLNGELVELEQSPDDMDMLNSVFRGFHTIKGGAGFLGIEPMVQLCHRAEDIFNLLRNGERNITPELMDAVLPVLDILNDQFDALRSGSQPDEVEASILSALEQFRVPQGAEPDFEPVPAPQAGSDTNVELFNEQPAASAESEDITDEEFEVLLDALENPNAELPYKATSKPVPDPTVDGDDISEEEFEALLDQLHGKGKFSGVPENKAVAEAANASSGATSADSDEITEEEFEALLDDLHGKGKFSAVPASSTNKATDKSNQPAAKDDEITEEEFEALLDDLHGKGKFGGAPAASDAAASKQEQPKVPAVAKPEPVKAEVQPAKKTPAKVEKKVPAKEKPVSETSVRVDTSRLDDIMNMVGELVLVRNRISRLGERSGNEEMLKAVANLDLVTSDLQLSVMKTRMQPIKKVFGRFPRVVRDLARNMKKEIRLEMIGEETDLDKNLVEALADPLVHLVRNAVDHGIEMPDDREKVGKPREGTVVLTASQEGDHILLSIEDDGKGMDPDVLRGIAVKKGLMDEDAAARLDDRDCYSLIFAPGFSTKEQISDISGRGVGMDVVKTKISQLNGTVEIDSQLGKGSRLDIKVPLTLAIMSTLMVRLKNQLFALPLVNVSEIFHLDLTKTNVMDGQLVILIREKTLPLFYLNRWLVKGESNAELPNEGHVVVVHLGNQKVGFVVDELIGQEEVVIKPLGALLHGISGLAGATITGDGGIAIILDVPGLMKMYA